MRILVASLVVMGLGGSACGQMVRMRESVVVARGADVRLGELATVKGAGAERLAECVVVSGVQGALKVKAEAVLMAVVAQRGAAATVGMEMSGSAACEIRVAGAEPVAAAPAAVVPVAAKGAGVVAAALPVASDAAVTTEAKKSGASLSEVIARRVRKELGGSDTDVHVTVETVNPVVGMPAGAGREWLVKPLTRTFLGTMQFEAQLVEGEKAVTRLTVTAEVERKVKVVVLTAPLARGEVVTGAGAREEQVWLDREMPTLFGSMDTAEGLEAKVPLAAGSRLDQRDFKASEMAGKGDEVTVVFLKGAMNVRMRGTAQEAGKMHSVILVKNEKTSESYQATLIGKRLAVVGGNLTAIQEAKLREVTQ